MRVLDRIRRGSYIRAWLAIGRILFLGKIIMSVPKLLYSYSVPALQQPLLPAAPPHSITEINDMSTSKRSEASNYDFSDIHPAIEAHSFTSEAFHRFGNVNDTAGGAKLRQQEAASNWAGGSDSDGLFSGGIDANSDPEVAAYVQKARSAAETGYGEEPELDLNYSITRNTSGASSAIINCGKIFTSEYFGLYLYSIAFHSLEIITRTSTHTQTNKQSTDPGDKVYYKHDKERTKFEVKYHQAIFVLYACRTYLPDMTLMILDNVCYSPGSNSLCKGG